MQKTVFELRKYESNGRLETRSPKKGFPRAKLLATRWGAHWDPIEWFYALFICGRILSQTHMK